MGWEWGSPWKVSMGLWTIQDCTSSSITPCSCLSCRGPIGDSPPWEWLDCNVLLLSYKCGTTTHEPSQHKRAENRTKLVPEMYLNFPPTALNFELLVLDIRRVSNHSCLVLSDAQPLIRLSMCDSTGWEEGRAPDCDSFSLFPLLL